MKKIILLSFTSICLLFSSMFFFKSGRVSTSDSLSSFRSLNFINKVNEIGVSSESIDQFKKSALAFIGPAKRAAISVLSEIDALSKGFCSSGIEDLNFVASICKTTNVSLKVVINNLQKY